MNQIQKLAASVAAVVFLTWGDAGLAAAAKTKNHSPDLEARALVQEILSQRPESDSTIYCVLKIRDGNGKRFEVPVKYSIQSSDEDWKGIYEARGTRRSSAERLVIVHRGAQPKQYLYGSLDAKGRMEGGPAVLKGSQAFIPFANSDYALADLGLEFLHWPEQRLVREAKIKMRMGRSCKVIESTNAEARKAPGVYSRVVSWIDSEYGFPVYAEAFDADGGLLKVFSLKGFKKINGRWEAKDLEIRNEKTDSRTRLEFQFESPQEERP